MPRRLAKPAWRCARSRVAFRFLVWRRARLASPRSGFYLCSCQLVLSLGIRLRNSSQPDHPMLSFLTPYCPKTRIAEFSGSLAMIIVWQPAEPPSTFDRARSREGRELWPDDLVFQPLMVSLPAIMENELRSGAVEQGLSNQNEPFQAGLLDGPHQSFRAGASE